MHSQNVGAIKRSALPAVLLVAYSTNLFSLPSLFGITERSPLSTGLFYLRLVEFAVVFITSSTPYFTHSLRGPRDPRKNSPPSAHEARADVAV
jgi:hypothetical protein